MDSTQMLRVDAFGLLPTETLTYPATWSFNRTGREVDEIVDAAGHIIMPGFFNAHTHSAMTLFRGYAEDLPLDRWLNERIFPIESALTAEWPR